MPPGRGWVKKPARVLPHIILFAHWFLKLSSNPPYKLCLINIHKVASGSQALKNKNNHKTTKLLINEISTKELLHMTKITWRSITVPHTLSSVLNSTSACSGLYSQFGKIQKALVWYLLCHRSQLTLPGSFLINYSLRCLAFLWRPLPRHQNGFRDDKCVYFSE